MTVTIDGTSGITTPAVNVGQIAGMRNVIINGGMGVDQRNSGSSQTFSSGAALAYSVDRWYGYCTGANVTGQQVAGSGSTQYRYRFTGASSVTGIGFGQRIEAVNSYFLAGNTATLSVDLANSVLTTVTWTAYYANSTDTFGTLASPTRTQIATGTFTVNSTVTRYAANISVPAAATTGIEIVLTVGAQTSGTWTIGNVQLELGSQNTPFENRPVGTELGLCQRYYAKSYNQSTVAGSATNVGLIGNAITVSANPLPGTYSFPVTMRTAPTFSYWDAAGNASKCSYFPSTNTSPTNNASPYTAPYNFGNNGFMWLGANGTSFTVSSHLHYTANAEL